MKLRYAILLGVLAFLLTLLVEAPAALLYAATHPEKNPTGPRLYGVHGTLLDGGFAALAVNGRPALADLHWRVNPWWLPLLRLSADLDAGGEAPVHLNVSRAVFGKLRLADITASGSVKALLGLVGQPNLPIEGQAEVNFPLVRLDAGVPVEARGDAEVRNLAWTLSKDPLPLGSFSATVSTDDKGILVSLDSGPGPLQLQGSVTVSRDHAYDLHVQVRPKPEAPPALLTLVRSLGTADAQGWYQLRKNGSLAPPAAAPGAAPAKG